MRVLVLLLGLGVAGCTTVSRLSPAIPARPPRAASLDEIRTAYDAYCRGVETLSATGDLDVSDLRQGKTQKLSVRFVADRGGRLYLKGSVAVVTALEVVSNGDRFWFSVPSKKTVWTGPARSAGPRREGEAIPAEALRPHDLIDAFLPEPLRDSPDSVLLLEGDAETFSLCEGGSQTHLVSRRIFVSRETLQPIRSRTYDSSGNLAVDVGFASWQDGVPRAVDIFRPLDGYRASFKLSKAEKNVTLPDRAFQPRPPAGYAIKELSE